ncbi:MAG TPA: VWA domain-containing protein, partial [Chthoniobacteraceae bacterium]|nr:VWA domain-containing protein [Chthoniobacteraceae bacterium]
MLPGFASLAGAWLFTLLIPVVVFYFLKLKRPRHEISSLVLWRQVLGDQRVNSPFQRFKRHFLLLLQILLLCLLALAAMQPFLRRERGRGDRLVVLIDTSASMAALDREGGQSALDQARKRVRELTDNLLPGQELSLIAFDRHARRLTPFTDNRRELRAALDALEVEDVPGDLEEALRMAQALARGAAFEKVLLFSDGNFPAKANFELPFAIDFQRLPPAGPNFGVTACEARRAPGGKWNVFVQIDGSANSESITGALELSQNGAVIATEDLALAQGSSPRLSFTIASEQASFLHAHLRLAGFDSLAADNDAWLTLPAAHPLAVFVAPKLASYRHVFAAMQDIRLFPDENEKLPAAFDLVISDIAADLALPALVRCGIGIVPDDARALVTIENRPALAIDWRRDSPLLQHVSLSGVIFMDEPVNAPGVDDARYANLGYEILARAAHGPLMLARADDGALRVSVLFHTDRSTLPYRVGFPVFVSNLVQAAWQRAGLAEAVAARTGVL